MTRSSARPGLAFSFALLASLSLGACAVPPPSGPTIMLMPEVGKSYPAFQADDRRCRQAASVAVDGGANAVEKGANRSLVVGTVFGASEGALIGAAAGNPAAGAAAGAAAGLLFGGTVASGVVAHGAASVQRVYDVTYLQCMAAASNTVPASVAGGYAYPLYGYPYAPPYGYSYY